MTAQPGLPRGRGELGADPAGADDHDVVLPGENRPQPLRVVQGAQQVHAGHTLRAGQPDRLGARGEDEDVVGDGTGPGVQFVVGGAQAEDLATEHERDAEALEVDVEGGTLGVAEQNGLGQRRAVVGLVGLRADQRHRAVEALFAQGDGGLHPGHARADDHHAPPGRAAFFLPLLAHLITLGG